MVRSSLALLLTVVPLLAQAPRVGVDPRVELLSIVFRLAGNKEYNDGRIPAYNAAIDRHFAPYRDHEAVQLARLGGQMGGIGYDAPMSLAIHLSDVETVGERVPFDQPGIRLDPRLGAANSRIFLDALRRFVADAKFAEFLASQAELYETTNGRLRTLVETRMDLAWFEKFFGAKAGARFVVVPGLANGPFSYGVGLVAEDGVEEAYAILGVWTLDSAGLPVFQGGLAGTLVHEFTHSYTNPLIDRYAVQMEAAAARIFETVKDAMRAQYYSDPKAMLYESLVRASTARYTLAHDGAEAAARAIEYEKAQSFLWTGELFDLLGRYEADRETYPTLESFMPEVVKFFNELANN